MTDFSVFVSFSGERVGGKGGGGMRKKNIEASASLIFQKRKKGEEKERKG